VAISYDGKAAADSHGFQVHVGYNLSKSRGSVTLRSKDPMADPVIRFNYMSHEEDWIKFRHCVRITREIFRQPAFDEYRGPEIQPGDHVQTDEQIDEFLREHLESAYHPCGTCRMGDRNDPMAVVDPETRVIGVDALRVVDSSIFPHVTNGNLNAPSIMTGEKAADHILGRQPLARSNQQPWINPRWETSDR
jgi:choline dehydrogenase